MPTEIPAPPHSDGNQEAEGAGATPETELPAARALEGPVAVDRAQYPAGLGPVPPGGPLLPGERRVVEAPGLVYRIVQFQ